MIATEIVDAVGRYGMPTVAAGLVLWMFVRMQSRTEARADRLEKKLLGNGEENEPGKLEELRRDVQGLHSEIAQDREQRAERDKLVEERLTAGNGQFEQLTAQIEAFDARCATRHGEAN